MLAIFSLSLLWGCKPKEKDDTQAPVYTGALDIQFEHALGSRTLHLDTSWYINSAGDSMRMSLFRYYVSNITLHSNGAQWKIPETYYLIDESYPLTKKIALTGLPEGSYDGISFIIGVDSARNMSGAQTGALDPQNDMFWGWASGYIFLKAEGYYMDSIERGFSNHIGGFKYPYNAIRTAQVNFGSSTLTLGTGKRTLTLKADADELFKTPQTISLKNIYTIHAAGPDAVKYADNYTDMFSLVSIQ